MMRDGGVNFSEVPNELTTTTEYINKPNQVSIIVKQEGVICDSQGKPLFGGWKELQMVPEMVVSRNPKTESQKKGTKWQGRWRFLVYTRTNYELLKKLENISSNEDKSWMQALLASTDFSLARLEMKELLFGQTVRKILGTNEVSMKDNPLIWTNGTQRTWEEFITKMQNDKLYKGPSLINEMSIDLNTTESNLEYKSSADYFAKINFLLVLKMLAENINIQNFEEKILNYGIEINYSLLKSGCLNMMKYLGEKSENREKIMNILKINNSNVSIESIYQNLINLYTGICLYNYVIYPTQTANFVFFPREQNIIVPKEYSQYIWNGYLIYLNTLPHVISPLLRKADVLTTIQKTIQYLNQICPNSDMLTKAKQIYKFLSTQLTVSDTSTQGYVPTQFDIEGKIRGSGGKPNSHNIKHIFAMMNK